MKALLAIGSNFGDRAFKIMRAVDFLVSISNPLASSGLYESKDCHGTGKKYMNLVLEMETDLTCDALNAKIKQYERDNGRDEDARKRGEVPVDIDIVYADGAVLRPFDFNADYFKAGLKKLSDVQPRSDLVGTKAAEFTDSKKR